ncbi:MAG TPA: cell division protein ZapA [Bacteroidia bacterium]|jgi:cell division protein ZapA (FtsZ GTPase activity inhibitor)|nr:cell division protein ZapA [Bacteroidia bacterium]
MSRDTMKSNTIKVNISGREYPVNVTPENEANMRKAVSLINEQVSQYSSAYAIKDPRDLLAMCALQIAFQQIEHGNSEQIGALIETRVRAIENVLHLVK